MATTDIITIQAEPTAELPDGVKITRAQAERALTLKHTLDDSPDATVVPIASNINGQTVDNNLLKNVFVFSDLYETHAAAKKAEEDAKKAKEAAEAAAKGEAPKEAPKEEKVSQVLRAEVHPWEKDFFMQLTSNDTDKEPLFNFILAANFLDLKPVLQAACKYVASLIKGKNADEIRKLFTVHAKTLAVVSAANIQTLGTTLSGLNLNA
jgi:S-phase kinase-associated protein 1